MTEISEVLWSDGTVAFRKEQGRWKEPPPGEKETPVTALTGTGARKAEEPGGTSKRHANNIRLRLRPQAFEVALYPDRGVSTHAKCRAPNPDGKGGNKRGEIKGWSKSSRAKLRRLLLSAAPPDGWRSFGVTFTIPGPDLSVTSSKKLWTDYCRCVERWGWLMIWRLELQQRGALHWHALLSMPEDGWESFGRSCGAYDSDLAKTVSESWLWTLDKLGPVEGVAGQSQTVNVTSRRFWPGAVEHAVIADPERGDSGRWLRYLADHASKSKQEQIAVGIGRHWGVVGRRWLKSLDPVDVGLTERQFWSFLRARQRLSTPRHPAPCVFGRKLGYRLQRGRAGVSVWFGSGKTDRRLLEWVKADF